MPRLPYVDPAKIPDMKGMARRNISLVSWNSPGSARHSLGLASYLRTESRLDAKLREMAIIQIGYLHRSPYDYTSHVRTALRIGVPEADIRAIAEESAGRQSQLSPLMRAVLRTAREMTSDLVVSDETFAILKQSLDNEQLMDLLVLISTYCGIVRLIPQLQLDLEEGLAEFLERFPFPRD